jgi:hypothetical protein
VSASPALPRRTHGWTTERGEKSRRPGRKRNHATYAVAQTVNASEHVGTPIAAASNAASIGGRGPESRVL